MLTDAHYWQTHLALFSEFQSFGRPLEAYTFSNPNNPFVSFNLNNHNCHPIPTTIGSKSRFAKRDGKNSALKIGNLHDIFLLSFPNKSALPNFRTPDLWRITN